MIAAYLLVGIDHHECLVLRLKTTDVQEVVVGDDPCQSPPCEVRPGLSRENGRPIGDEFGPSSISVAVVVLNDRCVGHDGVREDEGEPLADRVPEAAGKTPLGALALDAVDVQDHLRATQSRNARQDRVGSVRDEDDIVWMHERVEDAH